MQQHLWQKTVYWYAAIIFFFMDIPPFLDNFVDKPVLIMDKEPRHAELECPVWDEFKIQAKPSNINGYFLQRHPFCNIVQA